MTNSIAEILKTELMFVIGSNTTETHPVIATFMKRAKETGAKLIVVDPRKIELSNDADAFIQLIPGTNIALINAMIHVIIKEKLYDEEYINSKVEGFSELKDAVKNCTPKWASEICGVSEELIVDVARMYASASKAGIYYTMGVTQHTTGTNGVMSLSNLALICGNVGIEGGGVNPLRGQNNVQGACDMGGVPNDLVGYQKVANPEVIAKFEKAWNTNLSSKVGLILSEMFSKATTNEVKMIYIMGENPLISDPDITHVKEALEKTEFLVVQDMFLTETAQYADVVLPASSFAEKDGTFTNTERVVQRVRKAIEPLFDSKPDWVILQDLLNRIGVNATYENPAEIFDEIASLTPNYGGMDYDRLENERLAWPCPTKDSQGTTYLHKDKIMRGKGLLVPVEYTESAELADGEYPLILTTGRVLYQYHTRSMTGKEAGLNAISGESYLEISISEANKLDIIDNEIIKVISRRGEITTKAKVTDRIEDNIVFMPFHFADGAANMLTNTSGDAVTQTPELKVSAVRVEKL